MVDVAYAMGQSPSGGGSGAVMTQLVFFAAIFAIFYFLLIPTAAAPKRDRETMLGSVKKGDRASPRAASTAPSSVSTTRR